MKVLEEKILHPTVRIANAKDIEKIALVYAQAFDDRDTIYKYCMRNGEESFYKNFLRLYQGFEVYINYSIDCGYAFVIEAPDIIGVITGYEKPDMDYGRLAFIELFAVIPEFQGKGYGRALFGRFTEETSNRKICKVSLNTACYMDSYHIYRKWGFKDARFDVRLLSKYLDGND